MSDLWIIVCVFCSFSLIECQTVAVVLSKTDWLTAFQTCETLPGRLPSVNISNHQLELTDLSVTENISSPFWIGATYDFFETDVAKPRYEYKYPYTCCETIQNVGGNLHVKSSDCLPYNRFTCVTSTKEISTNETMNAPWENAYYECKNRNLRLPTRENEEFLRQVPLQAGAFWLDGIRQINFKPDIRIQNRNCLHSVSGRIYEGSCYNTSMTTVCIFDSKISGSESNTYTNAINTENPSKTGSLQTIGAVIGGVVGSVVVAVVITIVIVILVRKHRSRNDNNDQKEHHVSAHNLEKPGTMNSCFGVSRNSSLEKGNTKTANQTEATKDFHTQSQKHMMKEQQSSKHGKAVENTYERVASVLYSVVQKDLKPNKAANCGEQINGSEDNDEEYDKTSYCRKINQAASSGNVYDKANFKHRDNSEYDTTDDINFKHNDNSEYDTTNEINISIDASYDHV